MGITLRSKRFSSDMGYGGFGRFRKKVAEKAGEEIHEHYLKLSSSEVMFLYGEERDQYFNEYDATIADYIEKGYVTDAIANFLYQADCEGKIDRKQAKEIYELIKDCDDAIVYGYSGKDDCATMADLKNIFSDKTGVKWT